MAHLAHSYQVANRIPQAFLLGRFVRSPDVGAELGEWLLMAHLGHALSSVRGLFCPQEQTLADYRAGL